MVFRKAVKGLAVGYRIAKIASLVYIASLATQIITPMDNYLNEKLPIVAVSRDGYVDISNKVAKWLYKAGTAAAGYVAENADLNKAKETIDNIVSD